MLRWLKTVWALIPRDRLPIRQSHRHQVQRSDIAVAERLIDLVDGLRARLAGLRGHHRAVCDSDDLSHLV